MKQFVRRSNKAEELLPPRPMSPPSIPAKGQAHGYEVRPDGALAPQPPAIPGYSGHKDDAVGPGDYNPRVDTRFKNPKSTTFKVRFNMHVHECLNRRNTSPVTS